MRLLLAEDNAALVDELLPLLKASGYAVDVTGDGDETLFLGENESYDAVILDLGLPRLHGPGRGFEGMFFPRRRIGKTRKVNAGAEIVAGAAQQHTAYPGIFRGPAKRIP